MSFFPNSSGIIINGGKFVNNKGTNKIEKGIKLLHKNTTPGAFYNSDERYDPPKCHPRTREAVLQEIMDWIKDNDRLTRFLWLYGPAGAGKSAIEQTIAELCYQMNLLAASFFFSRSVNGRNNKTFLILTIVAQLIESIPEIREHVGISLYNNPSLLKRSLEAQMDELVVKPLKMAALPGVHFMNSRPKVIVLDGLDECGDPESQRYILKVLMNSINKHSIPFSFILASRPEQHIREAFDATLLNSLTTRLVLDDKYQPDEDIRVFLQSQFEDIKNRHPSGAHLPSSWPSDEDVERLVQKSSGQFIYASTIMKFIDSHRHLPSKRLDIVFGISPRGKTTPFAEIDSLYNHILTSASDNIDSALEILAVLLFLRHQDLKIMPRRRFRLGFNDHHDQGLKITPGFIDSFLSLEKGEVFTILSDLHSIIAVPKERNIPLQFFHASLGDFLTDHSRSGDAFFLESGVCHRNIVNRIINQVMNPPGPSALTHLEKRDCLVVFPELCLKSTPDPEFLSNLYGFDMSLCLLPSGPIEQYELWARPIDNSKIFKEYFDPINSASRIPELIVWMQCQKHPDQEKTLFSYHQQSIELWLNGEIFSKSHDGHSGTELEAYQRILASATLVDFLQFRDIHHLIPRVLALGSTKSRMERLVDCHQIEDSDKWEIYVKYRKIVSRFLIDRTALWSNGQEHWQYVSLARYLLNALWYQEILEENNVDIPKAVLIFLPIVFSQAGRSDATQRLLRAGSFSFNPQLQTRFPQENWRQLVSASYEACKLAIAAKGDNIAILASESEGTSTVLPVELHTDPSRSIV